MAIEFDLSKWPLSRFATGGVVCASAGLCVAALLKLRSAARRAVIRDARQAGVAEEAASHKWDYIIAGGGAAGCLLANRLTAAGKRVLVLEAGPAEHTNLRVRIPLTVIYLFKSKLDWNFESAHKPSQDNNGLYLCRGRMLGGSSCLNVMLHTRGDRKDYDGWESKFGCAGWGANGVLPYLLRSHNQRTKLAETDPKHHSRGDGMEVDDVPYQNELSSSFLGACAEAGLQKNEDFNNWDRSQEGFGRFQVYQRNGERSSAASALLEPAVASAAAMGGKAGPPLRVVCNTHVCKVTFGAGRVASGVRFRGSGGAEYHAQVKEGGEIILAGGAVHTPQLLMLSGLGPRAHLEEKGIQVLADLPGVGENLQDHPAVLSSFECPASKRGISASSSATILFGVKIPHPSVVLNWLFAGRGILTSPLCDHGGFFRTPAVGGDSAASPDLQLRFVPSRSIAADGMNAYADFFKQTKRMSDGFTFQVIAARPLSRGSVRLASADPLEKPIVEGGHLKDARDIATLREGLKLSRVVAQQPAFKDYFGSEVFPGPQVKNDAELDKYIVDSVHTANAIVGTCRMGKKSDPLVVCDPELCVQGVKGLRVCDASVMPTLPGGQGAAPTMAIAERASDLILGRPLLA